MAYTTPRTPCPFASAENCPIYNMSMLELSRAGCTLIKIDENKHERNLEKWKKSKHWPEFLESKPRINLPPEEREYTFTDLCTEIMFDLCGDVSWSFNPLFKKYHRAYKTLEEYVQVRNYPSWEIQKEAIDEFASKSINEIITFLKDFHDQFNKTSESFYTGCHFYEIINNAIKEEPMLLETSIDKVEEKEDIQVNEYLSEPSESTLLNYCTTENDKVFKISVITNGEKEGEASFYLYRGKISKERILMQLLIQNGSVTVGEILNACYEKEKKKLKPDDIEDVSRLLANIRSVVSDIRKKLFKNNINRDIITPLGQNIGVNDKVFLSVNKVDDLDKKYFNSKSRKSYKPPDEIQSNEIHRDFDGKVNLKNNLAYDPDKHIDGFDDEVD